VKKFKIRDGHAVSFRAEAYNLFNNVNFALPDASLSTTTFGQIAEIVGNPRYLQLALRYEFSGLSPVSHGLTETLSVPPWQLLQRRYAADLTPASHRRPCVVTDADVSWRHINEVSLWDV
jgi:hypothetical protein